MISIISYFHNFCQLNLFFWFLSRRYFFIAMKTVNGNLNIMRQRWLNFALNIKWKIRPELVLLELFRNCFTILIKDYTSTLKKKSTTKKTTTTTKNTDKQHVPEHCPIKSCVSRVSRSFCCSLIIEHSAT